MRSRDLVLGLKLGSNGLRLKAAEFKETSHYRLNYIRWIVFVFKMVSKAEIVS